MRLDVITFSPELVMAMRVTRGSSANVGELLELFDIIIATKFDTLPER